MKIHDVQQGSPEWFALRLGKFTCSDAHPIATNGKGLETLVFEKVAEILTKKSKEAYTNEAMENGKMLEAMARNSLEIEHGIASKQVGFIEFSDRIGGSPDGLIGEDGLIEIKCPTDRVFAEYLFYKKIDPKYHMQMQMQMYIMDRKFCDYVVFNPNFTDKPIIIQRVVRNDADIEKIKIGLDKGIKFVDEILAKI
jgi:putative phage-type endonuclease